LTSLPNGSSPSMPISGGGHCVRSIVLTSARGLPPNSKSALSAATTSQMRFIAPTDHRNSLHYTRKRECRLRVKTRHDTPKSRCPLLPRKPTFGRPLSANSRHDPYLHLLRNQLLHSALSGSCSVIHRPSCVKLKLNLENLDFAPGFATRSGDIGFGGSMSGRRMRRFVSDTAKPIIPLAAKATNSVPHGKILFLGAFAPLLVGVAVPILFRADMPSVAANSTLNCYDRDGNYETCVTRTSASPSRFNGRTTDAHQAPSWTTTALYQQSIWLTTTVDQSANWITSAVDQPANSTTSPPAARRSSTPGKRPAICGRRLIPCFFSALRRGLTHIAYVAATVGQPRPARERL
jgi:hypothetical protein